MGSEITPTVPHLEVERVPPDSSLATVNGVTLRGDAAADVIDLVGGSARVASKLFRGFKQPELYRLAVPPEIRKELATGALKYATPSSGDASTMLKHAKSGTFSGRADLKKVGGTALSTLGPVAWQVLAMATQQHFLVEISGRLDRIEKKVDEILARLDDDRLGTLSHVLKIAEDGRVAIETRGRPSESLLADLKDAARDADKCWHQVKETAQRTLVAYEDGKAGPREAEDAFAMFAQATKALVTVNRILASVPQALPSGVEEALSEERARVLPALNTFERLVRGFVDVSESWGVDQKKFVESLPNGRLKKGWNRTPAAELRRFGRAEPAQEPMREETTDRLRRLLPDPTPAEALLVEVSPDGAVRVMVDGSQP
jgi:hypothetical protein